MEWNKKRTGHLAYLVLVGFFLIPMGYLAYRYATSYHDLKGLKAHYQSHEESFAAVVEYMEAEPDLEACTLEKEDPSRPKLNQLMEELDLVSLRRAPGRILLLYRRTIRGSFAYWYVQKENWQPEDELVIESLPLGGSWFAVHDI